MAVLQSFLNFFKNFQTGQDLRRPQPSPQYQFPIGPTLQTPKPVFPKTQYQFPIGPAPRPVTLPTNQQTNQINPQTQYKSPIGPTTKPLNFSPPVKPFAASKLGIATNTILGLPKATKEVLFPTRGFPEIDTRETFSLPTGSNIKLPIPKIRPSFQNVVSAPFKIGAEIATLGELIPVADSSLAGQLLRTKFGNTLADLGNRISNFAKPSTAQEAAAMRVIDVGSILPLGSLRVAPASAKIIAESQNVTKIAKILVEEIRGMSDDVARKLGEVLSKINNVDDVQKVLNKVDFAINQAKQTPDIQRSLSRVGPTPRLAGLSIKPVEPVGYGVPSQRAIRSLATEARKYKSAEEIRKLGNDITKKYDDTLFVRKKVDLRDLSQTDHFDVGEYKQPYFKEMMSDVKKGKELPPIVVDKNGNIIDGNHRLESYLKANKNFQYVYKESSQTKSQLTDIWEKANGKAIRSFEESKIKKVELPKGTKPQKIETIAGRSADLSTPATEALLAKKGQFVGTEAPPDLRGPIAVNPDLKQFPQRTTQYFPLGRGPKILTSEVANLIKEFVPPEKVNLVFNPDLIKEGGSLGIFRTNPRMESLNPQLKPVIELMTKGGKTYVSTAFHESYHFLEEKVFSKEVVDQLNQETLAKMNLADHRHYELQGYKTPEARAAEYRADEFAKTQTAKAGYKSKIQQVIDKIKDFINKIIETGKKLQERARTTPNKQGGFVKNPLDDSSSLSRRVDEARLTVEDLEMILENHPAKVLMKYVSRTTGELPEVTGEKTRQSLTGSGKIVKNSEFGRYGDDIVAKKFGFEDVASAQQAIDDYIVGKKRLETLKENYRQLLNEQRAERLLQKDTESASKFLERMANKTDREIEVEAKKSAKRKIERIAQRAEERKRTAHSDLRVLEQSIYKNLPPLVRETPSLAEQIILEGNKVHIEEIPTFSKIVIDTATNVKKKVGILDAWRTPDRVMEKIGLGNQMRALRTADENYVAELPNHIDLIREWSKSVSQEGNKRIFNYLDGKLNLGNLKQNEKVVATEIKEYLKEWAIRLNLPDDKQISHYITHIFEPDFIKKEFDEELAKIIAEKIPGSVYDPFLQERLGKLGYIKDTWRALEAYAKRAVRKANMDPILEEIEAIASRFEKSQFDFVKKYLDRINLRPTDLDNAVDNTIKQIFGYRFGQRPTTKLTRIARQMIYYGALGLNFGAALKNLTQGVNIFAKLGTKYTLIGYTKLLTQIGSKELEEVGVLGKDIIQDRTLSAGKQLVQKADKGLFFLFELAEKINRGSAYFGAKAKALDEGKSLGEAIREAKKLARDTQFAYGRIDTPLALSSDIAKTIFQFGTFPIKQAEFLAEMAKNKEFAGIIRYIVASLAIVYGVGKAINVDFKDFVPLNYVTRFGTPPALGLPVEVIKAVLDSPGYFGQQRDLKKKLEDVLGSATIYLPAGIQIQKTYRGLKKYTDSAQTTPNLIKATLLGSKNLETKQKKGLPSFPDLPKLPKLPKLPTLPTL